MTALDCPCFHPPDVATIDVRNVDTERRVTVCARALRTASRLKADAHDPSARHMLADYGDEYGWGLWRSSHILYLIPPVAPFTPPVSSETAPVAVIGGLES